MGLHHAHPATGRRRNRALPTEASDRTGSWLEIKSRDELARRKQRELKRRNANEANERQEPPRRFSAANAPARLLQQGPSRLRTYVRPLTDVHGVGADEPNFTISAPKPIRPSP